MHAHQLLMLASEGGAKTLWDPTILGILTVLSGVVLFCGSTYLLLATNLGARQGFLIAFSALTGLLMLLSTMWLTTRTPLTSPKGRTPLWKVVEVVDSPGASKIATVRSIAEDGTKVSEKTKDQLSDLRPAVDAALVRVEALPGEAAPEQPFAKYSSTLNYLVDDKSLTQYVTGGGTDLVFWHHAKYAAVQFCPTLDQHLPFGDVQPAVCDPLAGSEWAVMVKDLGSIRLPPLMYLLGSASLFAVSLYMLHGREMAERARKAGALVPAAGAR